MPRDKYGRYHKHRKPRGHGKIRGGKVHISSKKPAKKSKSKSKKRVHCPGLEYLKYINTLILMQTPELIEILTGWSTANQYVIRNGNGQQVFIAFERTNELDMFFREQNRDFVIHIVDNSMQEVLRVMRENPPCACGGDEKLHVDAESPPGQYIGTVELAGACCSAPEYILLDHKGKPRLCLRGENATMCCAEYGYTFELLTLDGNVIGQIYKEFSNIIQEAHTNADNYILKFPQDLSVQMKALVIAAALQIDYIHFEQDPHDNNETWC